MTDLIGTVKIMNTRVYSGCGHAAVKEFPEWCPRCRIAELEHANNHRKKVCNERAQRIAALETELDNSREVSCRKVVELVQEIDYLQARLDTVLKDLKASAEWDEQFIRIKTEEFRRLTDWSKRKGDR